MLDLQWEGRTHTTTEEKAEALGGQFYPNVEADLIDIIDLEFANPAQEPYTMNYIVIEFEV